MIDLFRTPGADQHGRDAGPLQDPAQREVDQRAIGPDRDLPQAFQDSKTLVGEVDALMAGNHIEASACGDRPPSTIFPGEKAGAQGAVGDDPQAVLGAHGGQPPFDGSIHQIVNGLHGLQPPQTQLFREGQGLQHVVRIPVAAAVVADLALLDEAVKRVERFLQRRLVVPGVGLQQVQRFDAETSQAAFHRLEDMLARQAAAHLRRHDHRLWCAAVPQPPAEDGLGSSVAVHGRGVQQIDAVDSRPIEHLKRRIAVDLPSERHASPARSS